MLRGSCYGNRHEKCIRHKNWMNKSKLQPLCSYAKWNTIHLTVTDQNSQVLICCKFSVIKLRLCSFMYEIIS